MKIRTSEKNLRDGFFSHTTQCMGYSNIFLMYGSQKFSMFSVTVNARFCYPLLWYISILLVDIYAPHDSYSCFTVLLPNKPELIDVRLSFGEKPSKISFSILFVC